MLHSRFSLLDPSLRPPIKAVHQLFFLQKNSYLRWFSRSETSERQKRFGDLTFRLILSQISHFETRKPIFHGFFKAFSLGTRFAMFKLFNVNKRDGGEVRFKFQH